MRVYNFSAGPAVMPEEVLKSAADEMLDWQGGGMSVMEVSHRGKPFVECAANTEQALRDVMGIPDNYKVLFLQGGASGQFAAIPMNLTTEGDTIDLINTGQWSKKAGAEASNFGITVNTVATESSKAPAEGSYALSPDAKYLHYTPNETIGGVKFPYIPDAGEKPLIADMSSMIISEPLDVSKFGVIFGGTQKNMGPAGMAVVIVRDDLLGRARKDTPGIWNWQTMAESDSMLNTPPTFSIYLLGKILEWVKTKGGVEGMGKLNEAKKNLLYGYIDGSGYYTNPVDPASRSWMNVPFLQANPDLDKQFVSEATAAGLTNLAGHRSVGGMRASIYNAMPIEGVSTLVDFMKDFAQKNG